ncbi:cytochrome c [Halomonas sp. PR-M31]|uniref:c-type cytochrome n=1 Tax=Halomonas sp. PR-M31 TaxID=1471202 RepID=UPI0006524BCF|nr:cytochrome c [Halomonas sp. PR-M31]
MRYRHWGIASLLLLVAFGAVADPPPNRQTELETLLYQDCGSCHGMTLGGGLGPSLLPERMARYDVTAITAIILHGIPGTAMPPWSELLTRQDAAWLAKQLKKNSPTP